MELIKMKCKHCGRDMLVYDTRVKEQYCTIHCLESALVDHSKVSKSVILAC